MKWKIMQGGETVNIIEARESFVVSYCQEMGYTYELVPAKTVNPWIAENDMEPGEYVTVNKTMYKALLPIFAGAQITPGTNVEETTIEAELARKEN